MFCIIIASRLLSEIIDIAVVSDHAEHLLALLDQQAAYPLLDHHFSAKGSVHSRLYRIQVIFHQVRHYERISVYMPMEGAVFSLLQEYDL